MADRQVSLLSILSAFINLLLFQFVFKIKRPIFCTPTDNLPKGYDKVPGYKYYYGVLILYPGSSLGMNVKSYNGKVNSYF